MDSKVNSILKKRLFDFLGKQALAAEIGEGPIEHLVPRRLDNRQRHLIFGKAVRGAQLVAHHIGLDQGEGAASGADAQTLSGGIHGRERAADGARFIAEKA